MGRSAKHTALWPRLAPETTPRRCESEASGSVYERKAQTAPKGAPGTAWTSRSEALECKRLGISPGACYEMGRSCSPLRWARYLFSPIFYLVTGLLLDIVSTMQRDIYDELHAMLYC